LRSIEDVPVHGPSSTPDIPIIIVDCGELVSKKVLADRVEHGNACKLLCPSLNGLMLGIR
jgi:hypothetical protein